MDKEPAESLWVKVTGHTNIMDIVVGICHSPPDKEDIAAAFFRHLEETSHLHVLVLMGDFFERPWQVGEILEDQSKSNVTPTYRKRKKEELGNDRLVSLTLTPGKVTEQITLPTISKHMKNKKVVRSSQYGFTKAKSYLANQIAVHNTMTGSVDEGEHWTLFILTLLRLLTVSQYIIIDKQMK